MIAIDNSFNQIQAQTQIYQAQQLELAQAQAAGLVPQDPFDAGLDPARAANLGLGTQWDSLLSGQDPETADLSADDPSLHNQAYAYQAMASAAGAGSNASAGNQIAYWQGQSAQYSSNLNYWKSVCMRQLAPNPMDSAFMQRGAMAMRGGGFF